jgi:hydroxymethylbilane synthase
LDIALLNDTIDIAVHSMKDVPVVLAKGLTQAAVLERASHKDILVYKQDPSGFDHAPAIIASSSIRRIAQWLHRYPQHQMVSLRGNVNTRLRKLEESNWHGAIFAAAGLERINLRPANSIDLDWMLPAPAQGAIVVVCRSQDQQTVEQVSQLNHESTAIATFVERAFLKTLQGGCSTPVSALAEVRGSDLFFRGNIASTDGVFLEPIERTVSLEEAPLVGVEAAKHLLGLELPWIRQALKKQ